MHVGLIAAGLLTVMAPFEPRTPIAGVAGVVFTVPEVTWLVAGGLWVWSRPREPWWRQMVLPWGAWIGVCLVAALLADAHTGNALRATVRLATCGGTAWMVATTLRGHRDQGRLLMALVGVGVVVALGALGEVADPAWASRWLVWFRESVRLVGGDVRASGPLQYPTITAAVLAAIVVVACGLCLEVGGVGTRRGRLWVVVILVLASALAATLTRAGVAAALVGVVVWTRLVWSRERLVPVTCLVCAAALCLPSAAMALTETARLRWSTQGRAGWYRAAFDVPVAVSGVADADIRVPVTVRNAGRRTWRSDDDPPFLASYHIVEEHTPRVVHFEGTRTAFPTAVAPGASVPLEMDVRLPPRPGRYRIAWDVVQEHRLWFSFEPEASRAFTRLEVKGGTVPPRAPVAQGPSPAMLRSDAEPPGRLVLWRAALRMVAGAPLFGVGPDNFRLLSGSYLPAGQADERVHANNMYLEILVGSGVCGVAAWLWVLTAGVRAARVGRVRRFGAGHSAYAAVCGALCACLAHGLLDSFLTFTPTLQVMGVLVGVLTAEGQGQA